MKSSKLDVFSDMYFPWARFSESDRMGCVVSKQLRLLMSQVSPPLEEIVWTYVEMTKHNHNQTELRLVPNQ